MSSFWPALASTGAALALVLGLAWAALRAWHRLAQREPRHGLPADSLRIVRSLPLGARERVAVLEYRGNTYLLGVTATGLCVIDTWRAPDAPESAAASQARTRKHEADALSSWEASHRER